MLFELLNPLVPLTPPQPRRNGILSQVQSALDAAKAVQKLPQNLSLWYLQVMELKQARTKHQQPKSLLR